MNIWLIFLSVLFTFFSTIVLLYISMATMIGPWVAPTLVLLTAVIFKLVRSKKSKSERHQDIVLVQTVGSVGGLVATGVGFTLPTLYFLDPVQFNRWMGMPFVFSGVIAAACLAAGGFGIWLGDAFSNKMIKKDNLSFPVSSLIKETILASSDGKKSKELFYGFAASGLACFLRDKLLPVKDLFVLKGFFGNALNISITPMFWAVGFIVGPAIAMPLLVGMLSKYAVVAPLFHHGDWLPFRLFPVMDIKTLTFAFSAGLAVSELIFGLLKYPKIIWNNVKFYSGFKIKEKFSFIKNLFSKKEDSEFVGLSKSQARLKKLEAVLIIASVFAFLSFLRFPILAQILIVSTTVLATYQISFLGAKIGLVQFGRFATFIMIPTMLLFKLTALQITMLCVFVAISGAAASDLLFDYKIGQFFDISFKRIKKYQWLGLISTAACLGFFLWVLFTNLQLGTVELFAQRGMNRALLIQSVGFNLTVVGLGVLYGFLLKKLRVNPTMVFGGLLMPNSLTIGLVIGALGSMLSKKRMEQFPFFSGVFSGESVFLIVNVLSKMF